MWMDTDSEAGKHGCSHAEGEGRPIMDANVQCRHNLNLVTASPSQSLICMTDQSQLMTFPSCFGLTFTFPAVRVPWRQRKSMPCMHVNASSSPGDEVTEWQRNLSGQVFVSFQFVSAFTTYTLFCLYRLYLRQFKQLTLIKVDFNPK